MEESRTEKVTRNTVFSLLYKTSDMILAFILRTVFIYTLGKTYLGLNGLFSNILNVLSMMELGVGGAIVFSLYKPLAEKDNNKIAALMRLYKNVYRVIGIAICIIGFAITPLLDRIVNLPSNVEHINLIYWLSVVNTAISYFLAYRRSLIIADQRSDIDFKNQIIFRCIRFTALTIALLLFRNYIIYLVLDVLNTLLSNIQISYVVKKNYREVENAEIVPLGEEEKQNILKYMASGIFTKFGQTIVNCTDNILISVFISTLLVGIYSNYAMITGSLEVAIYVFFSGLTASIGNFALQKNKEDAKKLFENITFFNYIISAYFSVCLIALIDPFIIIWVGEEYVLSPFTVAVIVLNFYLLTMQKSIECFTGAKGELFYKNRYRGLIEGVVNLVASYFLVRYTSLGITGVFLGSTICFVAGRIWMDSYILFRFWFRADYVQYLMRYILRLAVVIIISTLNIQISKWIFGKFGIGIVQWIMTGGSVTAVSLGIMWIMCHKKEEYRFWLNMAKNRLGRAR